MRTRASIKDIDYSEVSQWFYVDSTSPSGLRWLQDCNMVAKANRNYRSKGDPAGYKAEKYWIINLKNKEYTAARVVYCLAHGAIPNDRMVDHIDGDSHNNRIENLRLADVQVNGRNRKMNINNTTGRRFIHRVKIPNRSGKYNHYYRVTVQLQTRKIIKSFNIGVLGEDEALKRAIEFKNTLVPLLVLDGYTERHINE